MHRQYLVQFAEACIRCIVWRRYHVLPNMPTWAVMAISIAWQVWLVTFAAILQARHVSAFRRQRRATAAAAGPSTSAPSSTAAVYSLTAEAAEAPSGPVGELEEVKAATADAAAAFASATSISSSTATSAAGSVITSSGSAAASRAAAGSRRSVGSRLGPSGSSAAASAAAAGSAGAAEGQQQQQLQQLVPPPSAAQQRYMRALRSVARGPSSYVLLSHQRRQVGGRAPVRVCTVLRARVRLVTAAFWRGARKRRLCTWCACFTERHTTRICTTRA